MSTLARVSTALLPVLLVGCATAVNGPTQRVGIASTPTGASVSVDGVEVGRTPMVARLERDREHVVTLSLPGHATREVPLVRSVSPWVWGNAAFGLSGLIGAGVDASTGGLYRLSPGSLDATLPALGGTDVDSAAAADVSPSGDALELEASDAGRPASSSADGAYLARVSGRRGEGRGVHVGLGAAGSSFLPIPLPSFDIGREFERAGLRVVLPPYVLLGRYAIETTYAVGSSGRARLYATGGAEVVPYLGYYEFLGLGIERDVARDWFIQLDATSGRRVRTDVYDDTTGTYGEDEDRFGAIGLKIGIRRR